MGLIINKNPKMKRIYIKFNINFKYINRDLHDYEKFD